MGRGRLRRCSRRAQGAGRVSRKPSAVRRNADTEGTPYVLSFLGSRLITELKRAITQNAHVDERAKSYGAPNRCTILSGISRRRTPFNLRGCLKGCVVETIFGIKDHLTIAQECARAVLIFAYGLAMLRLSGKRTFAMVSFGCHPFHRGWILLKPCPYR